MLVVLLVFGHELAYLTNIRFVVIIALICKLKDRKLPQFSLRIIQRIIEINQDSLDIFDCRYTALINILIHTVPS